MRVGIRTSLLSIACVVAVSGAAHAAASVRSVGGTGTYQSASSAAASSAATSSVATPSTTSARAGSLRATGGYVRPTTATTSAANKMAKSGSTTSRVATAPRLSIGKYVGAPKSVSQSGGSRADERIETLERLIEQLETEKQVVLKDTRYITITNDEVTLNTENLIADLELHAGEDGRPVELDANNDTGIKWRYVAKAGEPEDTWRDLISWESIKNKIVTGDIAQINQNIENTVNDIQSQLAVINSSISTLNTEMDTKVDKNQGVGNVGRVLSVDATGHVTPGNIVYSQTEIDTFLNNIGDDLDTKENNAQGAANAGKVLAVGDNGDVAPKDISDAISVDMAGKVDKFQGVANSGKGLTVGADGNVGLTDLEFGSLAFQTTIDATNIPDRSITSQKIAEHAVTNTELATEISQAITDAAMLERFWAENAPGEDALLSIGPDGAPQWFLVAE